MRILNSCILSAAPQALRATQETIRKWQVDAAHHHPRADIMFAYNVHREQFKYDYDVLQARLHTLPDSLTHDVMVRSFKIIYC